jgi:hypothetical protein
MDDLKPQRRSFQFSLRKLMLWMVICAAYLGIMRWLEPPSLDTVWHTLWFGTILLIRITFGVQRGFIIAICFSAVLFVGLGFGDSFFWEIVFVGICLGAFAYLLVSFVVWLVNKVDTLMQAKPHRHKLNQDIGRQDPF